MNSPSSSGHPSPLGNETDACAWRRRYELTAAAAGHVTYECNVAAGTLLWSGSLTPVLGYTLAEMQGGIAQWADLIHPDDRDEALRALDESERCRGAYDAQYRFRHKNGHHVWIRDRGLRGDNGALIGVMVDITEHRRTEQALATSEARWHTVFEAAPYAIAITRLRDGVYLEVNPAFEQLSGYRADEVLGKSSDMLLTTASQAASAQVTEQLKRDRIVRDREAVTLSKDGSSRDVSYAAAVVELEGEPCVISITQDITERRRVLHALQASEVNYRQLFEHNPAPMLVYERGSLQLLAVNEAFERHYGYTATEVQAMRLTDLYPPEERASVAALSPTLKGHANAGEWHHRKRDGTLIDIVAHSHDILFEGRTGRIAVITDITERKRAEAALGASERLFRAVFEQAPHFIGVLDLEGNLRQINLTASEFAGARPEELYGRPFWETPWWQHSAVEQARLRDAIVRAAQGEFIHFETTHPTPAGELRIVDFTLKPVRDEAGRVVVLIPEGRDITERRRADEALLASEARYRSLVDGMQDIVYAIDATGRVGFIGPQVHRFGFVAGDIIGRHFKDFVLEEDRAALARDFGEALATGKAKGSSFRIRTTTGALAWVENAGTVVRDAEGRITGISGILRDVTETKRAESERQALQTQLIQAQKMEAVGQLAGGVAHDFNNILTAILMQLSLLREEQQLSPEIQAGLRDLEGEARRAANLTRQLLMFSRRQVLQTQVLDLNSLLGNLLKMLRRLIGEHIVIELSAAPGDLWVEADAGMLEQVVMNLVVNARDAMPSGGSVTLKTRLAVFDAATAGSNPDARAGRFVHLTVADTGCGMDAETVAHIFEPFFTTKEVGRGTGLGLATVYGIVNQHRGWVEVHSEIGRGSTFEVFLPASAEPVIKVVDEATFATLPRGRETLLVVEDEASVRHSMVATLQRIGYRVLQAGNGPEALQTWARQRDAIQLLITDVVMPGGLSGLDLADRALEEKPGFRVILISGYSLEMAKRGLPRSEALRFLQKPFEAVTLARLVRECLDARAAGR